MLYNSTYSYGKYHVHFYISKLYKKFDALLLNKKNGGDLLDSTIVKILSPEVEKHGKWFF